MANFEESDVQGRKERFNRFLAESIDEFIDFGGMFLRLLELSSLIKRDHIAERLEILAEEWEDLLGSIAPVLESHSEEVFLEVGNGIQAYRRLQVSRVCKGRLEEVP